jgi:diaminohydroxyphosphoribosylaminopyrimidine deaminase/5-amino-6-(5-phosphoribosylamino)uracil reductase
MVRALRSSRTGKREELVGADGYFLERALELAWHGAGRTRSNPMVGAVVVRDGEVVGEGFHAVFGQDHAETVALDKAGSKSRGATLFVTLEPCTHQGKTPPCTDRIVESGIERVVLCTLDPDPRMDGKGVGQLKAAGIRVDVGHHAERAIALNLPYFKRMLDLGPAVTLKMAVTVDGRIASRPGVRDRITAEPAQEWVHRLRATRDVVVVGINTLLVDAPRLDTRCLEDAATPVPVVLDSHLRFPVDYPWLADGRGPIVLTRDGGDRSTIEAIERAGGRVDTCGGSDDGLDVGGVLDALARHSVTSALIEGGAGVFTSFLESEHWDDVHVLVAPAAFGPQGVGATDRRIERETLGLVTVDAHKIGDDVHISYVNARTLQTIAARVT